MKKWIWIPLAALAVLVATLPWMLSVPPGKWLAERSLSERLRGKIEIGTLQLSWFGPQSAKDIRFQSTDVDATIRELSSNVSLWNIGAFQRSFKMNGGAIQIHAADYPPGAVENVNATVNGAQIEAAGTTQEGGESGSFVFHATTQESGAIALDIALTRMPSTLLDRYLQADGKLAALLGSSFNANGAAKIHGTLGTVDLDLASPNATASINAAFTDSAVTLREPLLATLHLTPRSSMQLLGRALESQDPITLKLQPEGFLCPRTFSLGACQIERGTLGLGRLNIQNVNSDSPLFSLLKRNPRAGSMNAWFTDMDFSLARGKLDLSRVDCLLDRGIHLCAWGSIYLVRDKLDLIVGIPADTLMNALGISGLPESYVLKIPVQGSIQNPEAITGPASAKIAALVAGQSALKQTPFGAVLGIFNAATNDSSDVPPPKRPFPWER